MIDIFRHNAPRLTTLRHNTYVAASKFSHAQVQHFNLLFSKQPEFIEDALVRVLETGEVYMRALHALLDYLQAADEEENYTGEIDRTRSLIEMLYHELAQAAWWMKAR